MGRPLLPSLVFACLSYNLRALGLWHATILNVLTECGACTFKKYWVKKITDFEKHTKTHCINQYQRLCLCASTCTLWSFGWNNCSTDHFSQLLHQAADMHLQRILMKSVIYNVVYNFHLFTICRVDKKRDKLERKVLDSQERAFWDVHRPAVRWSLALLNDLASALILCSRSTGQH